MPSQARNDWYADRRLSGGVIVDLMVHDFDYLLWTFGPVERVFAKAATDESSRLDVGLVTLRFRSGTIAHVQGSWVHSSFQTRFEFAGSKGLIEHDSSKVGSLQVKMKAAVANGEDAHVPVSLFYKSPYQLELEDFVAGILHHRPFRMNAADGLHALQIALAAGESARQNAVVTMTDEVGGGLQ